MSAPSENMEEDTTVIADPAAPEDAVAAAGTADVIPPTLETMDTADADADADANPVIDASVARVPDSEAETFTPELFSSLESEDAVVPQVLANWLEVVCVLLLLLVRSGPIRLITVV